MKRDSMPEAAVPVSLQHVIDRVAASTALSENRRRDLRSAIVTYGKILGQLPITIALDLASIRKTLEGVVPLQAKVSRKRWANLRSDIAAAIAASELQPMLKTAEVELDAAWQSLLEAADDQGIRTGLSRFARWASLRQIGPASVNDAVLQRFFVELEAGSLIRNIRSKRRLVAKLWNRLATQTPDQDLRQVAVPSFRPVVERVSWNELPKSFRNDVDTYLEWCRVPDPLDENARARALPFSAWPETDKLMWQRAVQDDDPFGDSAGARLAERTLHKLWMGWRRFLGFLTATEPAALELAPQERLTPSRVRALCEDLRQTNTPHSVAIQMDSVYSAARSMMPETDWSWLREIKRRLFAAAPRGSGARPVITSAQLIDLGFQLMAESRVGQEGNISLAQAVLYRDGLMIAFLGHRPLRHKDFGAIEIDRELVQDDGNWHIVIPPEETKTRIWIEFSLPEDLSGPLRTYLNRARPRMLQQPDCKALWVSAKGGPLSYSAVGPVMTRHTTDRLGIRVTPHDARDAGATQWAIAVPKQIGIARDLLGHAHLDTTIKHYNRAKGIQSSRAHSKLIAQLKRSARPMTYIRRRPDGNLR